MLYKQFVNKRRLLGFYPAAICYSLFDLTAWLFFTTGPWQVVIFIKHLMITIYLSLYPSLFCEISTCYPLDTCIMEVKEARIRRQTAYSNSHMTQDVSYVSVRKSQRWRKLIYSADLKHVHWDGWEDWMHVLQIIPRLSLDEALIKSPTGERWVRGGKNIEIGLLQKYRKLLQTGTIVFKQNCYNLMIMAIIIKEE